MTTYLSTPNRSGLQNFLFRVKIALYQFRSPAKVLFLIAGLITSKLLLDYLISSEILSRLNIPFDTIVGFFGVGQLHLVEHTLLLSLWQLQSFLSSLNLLMLSLLKNL